MCVGPSWTTVGISVFRMGKGEIVMDETSQGISFNRIDRLVTQEGFYFQAWDDRYSKGVWAALGLWENQVDIVRDLSMPAIWI